MIRLIYKDKEHFATTLVKLLKKFPELEEYKNRIYNNRLNYKGLNFTIEKIELV